MVYIGTMPTTAAGEKECPVSMTESDSLPTMVVTPQPSDQSGQTVTFLSLELTDAVTRVELSESTTPIVVLSTTVTLEGVEDVEVTLEVSEAPSADSTSEEPERREVERNQEGQVTRFTVTDLKTLDDGVRLVIMLTKKTADQVVLPKMVVAMKACVKPGRTQWLQHC